LNRIGIVGGLGPEATIEYYSIIIQGSYEKFKGSTPEIIIYSLDLAKFTNLMKSFNKEKDKIINYLLSAIDALYKAGASFVLIASNTPHIVFDEICEKSPIPLISIVEETLKVIESKKIKKVGLFGTKFTMQSDFYQKVFSIKDIEVLTPNDTEQNYINYKLYDELVFGKTLKETREGFLTIAKRMIDEHDIEGLILGCTEVPLLLEEEEYHGIPFFNTTEIHAKSALKYKL
jgi:aspartate racemase